MCFIYFFGSLSTQHNWRHNRHNHGRRWRKCPPPHMRYCAQRRHVEWMGDDPPSLRMYFFGGLRVFMALKALLCSGDDASPQNRSVLRAMHTPTAPKIISACSGGYRPSIQRVGAERKVSCGGLGVHFRRRRPWSAMVVMVVGGVRQINLL